MGHQFRQIGVEKLIMCLFLFLKKCFYHKYWQNSYKNGRNRNVYILLVSNLCKEIVIFNSAVSCSLTLFCYYIYSILHTFAWIISLWQSKQFFSLSLLSVVVWYVYLLGLSAVRDWALITVLLSKRKHNKRILPNVYALY